MALDFHSHFVEVYRPLPRCLLCFFSPYTPKPASSNTRFLFFSLLLLLQFSRLPKKTCRTRNCSKIPQETWKVKVQKHIQRFVFNRLKYVLSTSLFACHCAHCSFFFFFTVLQPGRHDWHICQVFFIFCQRRSKSGFSEVNICLLVKERCWLIELIHRKMTFPYFQSSSQNGLNQANLKMECSNKKNHKHTVY